MGLIVFAILLAFTLSLAAAPYLPDQLASHWDLNGLANGYQSKIQFLWTMPMITLALALLLFFLPFIDPLKSGLQPVRIGYHFFIAAMLLFLDYIQALSIAYNLGFHFNLFAWMLPAFSLLMVGIGLLIDKVQPNWFVGIRTPWTLSSPSVWNKTHHLGGILLKLTAVPIFLGVFFPNYALWFLLVPLLGVAFFLVLYSYWLFQKEQTKPH